MHDVLVAAFLTLLTVIAYRLELFSHTDAKAFAKGSEILALAAPTSTDQAIIVEIDQATFETRFDGETPLARDRLAQVIESLSSLDRKLAIDLDLSPRGDELEKFAFADCKAVAEAADVAPRPIELALCSSKLPRIVLVAPFPTDGRQAVAKLRWMQFVCNIAPTRVDFALAYIPPPNGAYAVEYYAGPSTLAGVLAGRAGLCEKVRSVKLESTAHPSVPIEFSFLNRAVAAANQEELWAEFLSGGITGLLNFRLDPKRVPLSSCLPDACAETLAKAGTSRSALFLGGTWDASGADEFMTPLGRIPGLNLHAIAYAGRDPEANPEDSGSIKQIVKIAALAVEFAVAMALIALYRRVWRASDRALDGVLAARGAGTVGARARTVSVYVLAVLVVPIVVAVSAFFLIGITAAALSAYVWMVPSALLGSLLMKSYIQRPERGFPFASREWRWEHLPHIVVALGALGLVVLQVVEG